MQGSQENKATFAIVGLGYISVKHLAAIEHVGGELLAVCDTDLAKEPKTPAGAKFFSDFEKFLEFVRVVDVDYVVLCTPNNFHVPMMQRVLKETSAQIICEKPITISAEDLARVDDKRVNCILQLRYVPLPEIDPSEYYKAKLDIHIRRDQWYFDGWKGKLTQSGGLLFNIGIHYFDLLVQLFGEPKGVHTEDLNHHNGHGAIEFENAFAEWKITLDAPMDNQYRMIRMSSAKHGEFVLDLTSGIDDMHKPAYEAIVRGDGFHPGSVMTTTKMVEELTMQGKDGFEEYQLQGKYHNIYGDPKIGGGTKIGSYVEIGPDVVIGKNCKIQAFSFICSGVTLEDDVFIGPRVTFTNDKYPPSNGQGWSKTLVKKGAKIGAGAVLLPGITVFEGAIIGAGAVVTKDVPSGETWVGNPAKPL